ncbi:MAG: helix-hairpin-helix domain-containing protein [Candidatus Marinimicrobia bacterium]|nr:helix-hairpin-helix domain-containing protein [Candidatus Neomarinimicrobiota bacterium]
MKHSILLVFFTLGLAFSGKINLNTASADELAVLPLSETQIYSLIDYRESQGYFNSLYELSKISGFNTTHIHAIRKSVTVALPSQSTFEKDMQRASYKLGQWISNEGSTEGLSEVWLDRFYEPQNVNEMNYDDLMLLPNLSPVDVTAVLLQKDRGYIKGTFELKNSPGISYWGYKNLVDFVRFENKPADESPFHIRINSLVRTIPITSNPDDEGTVSAFKDSSRPEQFHKVSFTTVNNLKGGYSYHRYMGQPRDVFTEKLFLSTEKIPLGKGIRLDRAVLGNFTASFGQGVIFETGDDFSPRRTGYGFTKRATGIHGDLTRSSQYVMRGGAIQMSSPFFRGAMFLSQHPRDAVINSDSSFTSLIVMQPRLPYGANGDSSKIFHSLTGSLNEVTWGGNFQLSPVTGTHLGFTFFEALYDRPHIPQVINSITGGDDDFDAEFSPDDYDDYSGDAFYLTYITNSADAEIAAMDSSEAESELWEEAQSFFRVRGFDFSTVLGNIAIAGEYGEMMKDDNLIGFGSNPSATVVNAYTQFPNLNILLLYRNYDLAYDNPYQRSYSNYQRYKTTIFEDSYWLEDPIFSYLYSGNPQPQAEEGFFISSRYQFHRSFVGVLNWDTWNRKADNAKYFRTVATIDWRPAFNCRIKLRQKWQGRGVFDIQHPSPFYSRESRLQARLRMSRYNQFEILYSKGYTTFSPRPRLTDNALGGDMMVGDIGSPDETMGVSITHHADHHFTMKGGILYIKGFLWYFEDTDFRVFNSDNGAVHSWVSVDLKPTPLLRVMFKVSHSSEATSTRVVDGKAPDGRWMYNPIVTGEEMDYRLQLSYAL